MKTSGETYEIEDVVVFNSAILGYERSRHWRLASLGKAMVAMVGQAEKTRAYFINRWISFYGHCNLYI